MEHLRWTPSKADSRMLYPSPLNPLTGPEKFKNLDYEVCCICGLVVRESATKAGTLIPHAHFHTPTIPMHQFVAVALKKEVSKEVQLDYVMVRFENTICLHHLVDDPGDVWRLARDWYSLENRHSTNSVNIGVKLDSGNLRIGRLEDAVLQSINMMAMSLKAQWRSDFLEAFIARSATYRSESILDAEDWLNDFYRPTKFKVLTAVDLQGPPLSNHLRFRDGYGIA